MYIYAADELINFSSIFQHKVIIKTMGNKWQLNRWVLTVTCLTLGYLLLCTYVYFYSMTSSESVSYTIIIKIRVARNIVDCLFIRPFITFILCFFFLNSRIMFLTKRVYDFQSYVYTDFRAIFKSFKNICFAIHATFSKL